MVTVRSCPPVVDAVAACEVHILKQMLDSMMIIFMGANTILRTSNNCIPKVGGAR